MSIKDDIAGSITELQRAALESRLEKLKADVSKEIDLILDECFRIETPEELLSRIKKERDEDAKFSYSTMVKFK